MAKLQCWEKHDNFGIRQSRVFGPCQDNLGRMRKQSSMLRICRSANNVIKRVNNVEVNFFVGEFKDHMKIKFKEEE